MEKISISASHKDLFFSPIVKSLSQKLEEKLLEMMLTDGALHDVDASVEDNDILYQLSFYKQGGHSLVIMKENRDSNYFNSEDFILENIDFDAIENSAWNRYYAA